MHHVDWDMLMRLLPLNYLPYLGRASVAAAMPSKIHDVEEASMRTFIQLQAAADAASVVTWLRIVAERDQRKCALKYLGFNDVHYEVWVDEHGSLVFSELTAEEAAECGSVFAPHKVDLFYSYHVYKGIGYFRLAEDV